jgi:hypothetical protein
MTTDAIDREQFDTLVAKVERLERQHAHHWHFDTRPHATPEYPASPGDGDHGAEGDGVPIGVYVKHVWDALNGDEDFGHIRRMDIHKIIAIFTAYTPPTAAPEPEDAAATVQALMRINAALVEERDQWKRLANERLEAIKALNLQLASPADRADAIPRSELRDAIQGFATHMAWACDLDEHTPDGELAPTWVVSMDAINADNFFAFLDDPDWEHSPTRTAPADRAVVVTVDTHAAIGEALHRHLELPNMDTASYDRMIADIIDAALRGAGAAGGLDNRLGIA